ncbi:fibulin-1-like isoform X1 [Schistocerca gregaria]|uniref:fibulin-1-like isoform X1 n=1 Tax=Schistocerca gregaria TaxID=7010 RepID=UPI00211E6BFE|nr:fibulin-1-like isoform X1 [Schistocerca gregaria]
MLSPSYLAAAVASVLLVLDPPSSHAKSLGTGSNWWRDNCFAPSELCDAYEQQRMDGLLGPPGINTDRKPWKGQNTMQYECHSVYGPKRRDCLLASSGAPREEVCPHQFSQVLYGDQAAVNIENIKQFQEDTRSKQHQMWADPRVCVSGMSFQFAMKDQIQNCLAMLSKPVNCYSDITCKSIEEVVSSIWRNGTSRSGVIESIGNNTSFNESSTCGGGYLKGFYFDVYRDMWLDIDECSENISGCAHECENTIGSYSCKCRPGYFLQDDQKSCQDIDECGRNMSGCAQECENTDGSFSCRCQEGFSLMPDKKSCEDIDECRRNMSECSHKCVNTIGSYKCKCRKGYFLMDDQKSCDDHDECARDKNGRRYAPCTHLCVNVANGFMCGCPEGFVIDRRNIATCIDVRNVDVPPPGTRPKSQGQ